MSINKELAGSQTRVTFRRRTTKGESRVAVVGEFNSWSSETHQMTAEGDGSWVVTVTMSPGRTYRFRYLVDDEHWENDWEADDYVDNDFGGQDSVVDLREASTLE
jgi:1,4-alpha-glucan branching enzyme